MLITLRDYAFCLINVTMLHTEILQAKLVYQYVHLTTTLMSVLDIAFVYKCALKVGTLMI